MGTRASRLQEDPVSSAFVKDGIKRDSYRRPRCNRPASLKIDFSGSFDDSETNRSRSEEGSDSDVGQQASAVGSPADHNSHPSISQSSPAEDNSECKREEDGNSSPEGAVNGEHLPGEETGRVSHRTFSERLPGNRHSNWRNVSARSARMRGINQRPASEAWIGLYRVNNRHGDNPFYIRCPFCSKSFSGGKIENHLLSCLTSPSLPYNTDVLSKDSGECSICLEELQQGETIARLACLCVYHKGCIDSWSKVKPCCPEHPFD
ncbi:uncharacterized protein LOC112226722 isoform X1 [Oncorhynchus tshawytscha]|uniref:E3 ubiquitin-protein ligase ZNRF1 n=1 Tax=Oncorhynchus tshawytscha TaxID=74940 RepID=A0A8C8EWK8_ONCTS|nr:uncharacterized protein LOC112226722 isoform X1 [Oncorhynchus tshawytscha]